MCETPTKDDYWHIVHRLCSLVSQKISEQVYTLVLDGSVARNEHVPLLSDIDLKLFLRSSAYTGVALYPVLRDVIDEAVDGYKIKVNLWTLVEEDFPRAGKPSPLFDVVRAFVLQQGQTLLGEDVLDLIPRPNLQRFRANGLRAIGNFLIRVRRVATNPAVVTGLGVDDPVAKLSQGIIYSVHTARYALAIQGVLIAGIADVVDTFGDVFCLVDDDALRRAHQARQNWLEIRQHPPEQLELLFLQILAFMEKVYLTLVDSGPWLTRRKVE